DALTMWTIGHSNRDLAEFIEALLEASIEVLVDVRRRPASRFPHFNRDQLARALTERGIEYRWMGESLGGYRSGGYRRHMHSEEFAEALAELQELGRRSRTAFMCAEKLPWRCHRRFIADALAERGWRVLHIIEPGRTWEPTGRQESMDL
ncbi:MAG: DUF488 family protein, partial [Armatimonadota bacterium]